MCLLDKSCAQKLLFTNLQIALQENAHSVIFLRICHNLDTFSLFGVVQKKNDKLVHNVEFAIFKIAQN